MLLVLTVAFTALAVALSTGGFIASCAPRRRWRAFVHAAMNHR